MIGRDDDEMDRNGILPENRNNRMVSFPEFMIVYASLEFVGFENRSMAQQKLHHRRPSSRDWTIEEAHMPTDFGPR